jgi:hypothetical protein
MKKILFLLAAVLLTAVCKSEIYTGTINTARWTFDTETSTLKVEGSGVLVNDGVHFHTKSFAKQIKHIVVGEGFTSIQDERFINLTEVVSVSLPASLVEIKESAFASLTSLKAITLPRYLKFIDRDAFKDCFNY